MGTLPMECLIIKIFFKINCSQSLSNSPRAWKIMQKAGHFLRKIRRVATKSFNTTTNPPFWRKLINLDLKKSLPWLNHEYWVAKKATATTLLTLKMPCLDLWWFCVIWADCFWSVMDVFVPNWSSLIYDGSVWSELVHFDLSWFFFLSELIFFFNLWWFYVI